MLVGVDDEGREQRITYGQFAKRTRRLAAGLQRLGLRRGDRMSLWMTNSVDMATVFYAALRLGVMVVPMNTFLGPEEAARELAHARPRCLVMQDRFRQRDYLEALGEMCPEWPQSRGGVLSSRRLPELRTVVVAPRADGATPPGALSLEDVERAGDRLDNVDQARPDDVAALFYTSGTTRRPKGVLLEQWGIVTKTLLLAERLRLGADDRMFTSMPFFHVGGCLQALFRLPLLGGTLVFMEAHEPEREIDLMVRERCTVNYSLFAILHDQVDLLKRTGRRLDLRMTMAVGASAADLRAHMGARLLFTGWGLSEGYSIQACCTVDDAVELQDESAGLPLPGIEIRVVDPTTGRNVAAGEIGEAWVRGTVMRGYWEEPELTRQTIDADGWLHSGDLVRRRADGRVRYEGRLKAMLKVDGENVSPAELEAVIRSLPGVDECTVVAAPHPRSGEVPVAFVVPERGVAIDAGAVTKACAERLARFKIPRAVEVLDAMPLLPATSKVDRLALAARARQLVAALP